MIAFDALGIAAESPERSGVQRSEVRTCSGTPGPPQRETPGNNLIITLQRQQFITLSNG
jgi:hypothetical protein